MKFNNRACLQSDLASMDLCQLNTLLQAELQKDCRKIDDHLVRQIIGELETREGNPALQDNEDVQRACDRYRAGCTEKSGTARRPTPRKRRWFLQAAAIAAVVCLLLMVVPVAKGESNLLKFVTKLRADVIAFFNPAQADNRFANAYQTDHPGLQQLYDAVTEIGVTEKVVPAWIPEAYELVELKTEVFPSKTRVCAWFVSGEKSLVFYYDLYGIAVTHEYAKDTTPYDTYERKGVVHEIYRNYESYTVLWEQNNLKCSIVVDCQEDQLIEILKSIYKWRNDT